MKAASPSLFDGIADTNTSSHASRSFRSEPCPELSFCKNRGYNRKNLYLKRINRRFLYSRHSPKMYDLTVIHGRSPERLDFPGSLLRWGIRWNSLCHRYPLIEDLQTLTSREFDLYGILLLSETTYAGNIVDRRKKSCAWLSPDIITFYSRAKRVPRISVYRLLLTSLIEKTG